MGWDLVTGEAMAHDMIFSLSCFLSLSFDLSSMHATTMCVYNLFLALALGMEMSVGGSIHHYGPD